MDCLSDKTIFQVWHTGIRQNHITVSRNFLVKKIAGQDKNELFCLNILIKSRGNPFMKNDFLCFFSCASNELKSVPARDPGNYRVPILRTTHKIAPITFMNKKDLPRSSTMWKNNLAPSSGAGLAGRMG